MEERRFPRIETYYTGGKQTSATKKIKNTWYLVH